MYRYEANVTQSPYSTAAWRQYSQGLSVGFLDLETTGLSRHRDAIILGGLLRMDGDGSQKILQLLCDHRDEEAAMLAEFWAQVRDCHILVTYNGDSFDLPMLRERLRRWNVVSPEEMPPVLSFDLYRIFHSYCPMASLLPNLRQKTVETALGLSQNRKDEIDGAESVRLFAQYERQTDDSGRKQLREILLLHNRDDLLQLSRLMKLLDKVDLHRIMSRRGFLVRCGEGRILVRRISFNKKEWRIEATTWNLPRDADIFAPTYCLVHNSASGRLEIRISVMCLQDCIVADLEALPGDYSSLSRYPAYESGYLILHDGRETACGCMNRCIQLLLSGLHLA